MSRFTRYAATSQMLSLTAMEEASRRGLREADLEDLFLALVLSEQAAGQALRRAGVTIIGARQAVSDYQWKQIASLGITADIPESGHIVFHETRGYEWSKRARAIIGKAGEKGQTADAAAVLRELLNEPSGKLAELLHELGTTPAYVLEELARVEASHDAGKKPATRRPGEMSAATRSFTPADTAEVWALLSDPTRLPEWEPAIGAVEAPGSMPSSEATWIASARTTRPDGRPLRVSRKFRRVTVQMVEAVEPARVVWGFAYPDAPGSRPVRIEVDLSPVTGGTDVAIVLTWRKRNGVKCLLRAPLIPLHRFLLWTKLSQISSAISRAFR